MRELSISCIHFSVGETCEIRCFVNYYEHHPIGLIEKIEGSPSRRNGVYLPRCLVHYNPRLSFQSYCALPRYISLSLSINPTPDLSSLDILSSHTRFLHDTTISIRCLICYHTLLSSFQASYFSDTNVFNISRALASAFLRF